MATRMTDTNKWKDKWFRGLNPLEKILFIYLTENCDNAGFFEIDFNYWAYQIGADDDDVLEAFKGLNKSIEVVGDWGWIVNFLRHQRNLPLNEKNNAHKQIISLLHEHKTKFISSIKFKEFLGANLGLISPPVTYSNSNSNNNSKKEEILNDIIWLENICMKKNLTLEKCTIYLGTFLDSLELKNDLDKDKKEIQNHFINWLEKQSEKPQKKGYKI
jgi:hypothetical protein